MNKPEINDNPTPDSIYKLRDYTAERENLQKDITLDEIIKNVREIDKQYNLDKK